MHVNLPIFEIPYRLLPKLALTEDSKRHTEEGVFRVESVFDVMRRRNKSLFYDSFTALGMDNGDDDDRAALAISNMGLKKDLYMIFIGEVDSVGHYYGSRSSECRQARRNVDRKIKMIVDFFRKGFDSVNLLLVGDHGIVDVDEYFDVWKEVKSLCKKKRLVLGKDFFMFLDSTMARFWCCNETSRVEIRDILKKDVFQAKGRLITSELAQRYHIPVPSQIYGELIWWANPGAVIFPDYFHNTRKVKAMHGYSPELDESKGFCIVAGCDFGQKVIDEGELIDICPTLCESLDIEEPKNSEGKSFVSER